MFYAICTADQSAKVTVHEGTTDEPIIMRIGEVGVHMSREEALDLYSQLEKAIHSLVAVEKTEWVVKK
jgi:hypothetical protein